MASVPSVQVCGSIASIPLALRADEAVSMERTAVISERRAPIDRADDRPARGGETTRRRGSQATPLGKRARTFERHTWKIREEKGLGVREPHDRLHQRLPRVPRSLPDDRRLPSLG